MCFEFLEFPQAKVLGYVSRGERPTEQSNESIRMPLGMHIMYTYSLWLLMQIPQHRSGEGSVSVFPVFFTDTTDHYR